ncbi:MAG: adenosylcobinamide-phosphate synthase CbiB [Gammaproteobacteria bacterium]|nr:adenosylcobinamide-phosphate synthase CbiB [Gammaproteobacteria bacterium]
MYTTLTLLFAIFLDSTLGEPRHKHPLVGFGRFVNFAEKTLYQSSRMRGVIATLLLLVPLIFITYIIADIPLIGFLFEVTVLYLAIGAHSLAEHAMRVYDALKEGDLKSARISVSNLVSRDTESMNENDTARATIESVLENGNDAVFGALFWFIVAGAPGVVLYRLTNTLDAMWGYKTERYFHFGWAAARLDDLLNYIPARLTALTYALLGHFETAIRCWRTQGHRWKSPNAGPVMAAGAGALNIKLGGAAVYHGTLKEQTILGEGQPAEADDIPRAVKLVKNGTWLWIGVAIFSALFLL